MTRISASDHIMILLRQKLERSANLKKGRKAGAADRASKDNSSSVQRVRALAQMETLDQRDIERAMIQGMLVEELGEAVVNDPRFQQLVSRVVGILSEDDSAKALLDAARRELSE